ncbi:MAG: hypothetical protein VB087_01470 [Candidatus Limiplasma sp.]|nr:hypothetical protein [Candidatus Limiplasma sp.]
MKTIRHTHKGLLWLLALVLALCLCGGAMAESGTIFPWLTYTLDVGLATADPEAVALQDAPDGGTMILVKLNSLSGAIQTEDITAQSDGIVLRDLDGTEYTPYSSRVRGVAFDVASGLFSTNPEQDGFELLYFLEGKEASALAGAVLVVPTDVANEHIIVSLDKAPNQAATAEAPASSTEEEAPSDASFVLGGIRYTISALEDAPAFQLPNRMDGKEGHVVTFAYPGSGADAESANKLLYEGARLRQPNGDLVQPYSNMDNIGNPYELYFGLSDQVLLRECVFTILSDTGEVEIPLSALTDGAAQGTDSTAAAQADAIVPDQAEEVTPEPAAERAANTFMLHVEGADYALALDSVAYDSETKQMGVDIILYDHELLDFVADKKLVMPFGCGIISSKDGFLYTEGITATMNTPMHLIFYFDTKNAPELVCFGLLNEASYADSEDFALVDPATRAFVTTFPLEALTSKEKDPQGLLNTLTAAEGKPSEAESPAAEPAPSSALSESASDSERMIAEVLDRCAQGVQDAWQLAIYRAGAKQVQTDPAAEGVYTFLLRSFDPGLKALGKYQDDNQVGYLKRLLDNTKEYTLAVSLTMEDGAFTDKSVKALQGAVKKAAAASKKAFKDRRVLSAFTDELLFTNFPKGIKKAEDLYNIPTDYRAWTINHFSTVPGLSSLQWAPFFYGQTKQALNVAGGPFALELTCTGVDMAALLENARADALRALMFMTYERRWDDERYETEFRRALGNQVIAMKKKGKEAATILLNVDGSPIYDSAYQDFLGTYAYDDALSLLKTDTENLPDEAALAFPKAGWMSGSTRGTQVRIKAPKDSAAYYVQLRDYNTDQIAVSGFVRPGSTCTLRLPKGNYYFVMASGSVWYGEEKLFGTGTDFTKTGLFEVMSSNYYHTVTLKVVENGNMPIYGADEEDLH